MKFRPLFVCLLVAVVMAATGDAVFAEGSTPAAKEGAFDNSLRRYDLGIWTLVVFGALLFILWRFAWPQIIDGLDKRQAKIEAALNEAERVKAEAATLRSDLAADMAKANEQIRAMLDEARRDADKLRETEKAAGVVDAKNARDAATAEIVRAKDQAIQELYTYAVQLATQISGKVLERQVSPEDHSRLLDEAIADLAKTFDHTTPAGMRA